MKPIWPTALVLFASLLAATPVWAHANLSHSDPAPNTSIAEPPSILRLWFTEPLEPAFSQIRLRDTSGNVIETPESQVDSRDPHLLYLVPGSLPEGLYTVSWRVVSALDGHQTMGSFPIAVGEAASFDGSTASAAESIPAADAVVRWLNLTALSLAVGSIGFLLFVWNPSVPAGNIAVERRIQRLIWAGWLAAGIAGGLALLLQVSVAANIPLIEAVSSPALGKIVTATRFGNLWLTRNALWLGLGLALIFARSDRWFYWIALAIGGSILLIHSLYSHAAAALDYAAAVTSDWFHLSASALWIGGLIQFINIIGPTRRAYDPPAPIFSALVGHFSNFARVSVAGLIITGLYAGWLHVGSIEGLLTTLYGQALLVKIILILPLLAVAAVNLFLTHRQLQAGNPIWVGRLRGLVGAEIALTIAVLLAVGIMTSIAPSRGVIAVRGSIPKPPEPSPIVQQLTSGNLNLRLEITPGWIGRNTFILTLSDSQGSPVTDASLVRLRFQAQNGGMGESELRPVHAGEGVYRIEGDNLSVAGQWRIRSSVQRPGAFDSVVDFTPELSLPPAPPPMGIVDPNPPLESRTLALLLVGLMALGAGGFFAAQARPQWVSGQGLIAVGLILVGGMFLINSIFEVRPAAARSPANQTPIHMIVRHNMSAPYLITSDGRVLVPQSEGGWQAMRLDARVRDIEIEPGEQIWAAAEEGLFVYRDSRWEQIDAVESTSLESTHGYLFAMGSPLRRVMEGPRMAAQDVRTLSLPLEGEPARDLVMLGNHTHVVQNGSSLFLTSDLGLSWTPLKAPAQVEKIAADADGLLIASTGEGIMRQENDTWSTILPLPDGRPVDALSAFNKGLYAAAGGRLYRQANADWEIVELPDSSAHITTIAVQYPQTLWVLDSNTPRLWSTTDAENWTSLPITVN